MHGAEDLVETGALQGVNRATEDALVSKWPLFDSEVVSEARRRKVTAAERRSILFAGAACTRPGEIGALRRRAGAYSPALAAWRRQHAAGKFHEAEAKKSGPKSVLARAELKQFSLMTRERDKLRVQRSNAHLVNAVQKRCCVVGATRANGKVCVTLMAGTVEFTRALESTSASRAIGRWRGETNSVGRLNQQLIRRPIPAKKFNSIGSGHPIFRCNPILLNKQPQHHLSQTLFLYSMVCMQYV